MRMHQVPQLLDGLFQLRKLGIRPPTPLIIAMDGAGKNGVLESYTAERGLQLVVSKLSQCESPGDLLGFMATEEQFPCPICCDADKATTAVYREDDWLRHGDEAHQVSEDAMRAGLGRWRSRIRKASRCIPPAWLPTHGRGVYVLDEYNRANGMMENAALELIREHRFSMSGWHLPPDWILVALANPNTERFIGTNPLDAASESRVIILILEPTVDEFLDYARTKKMHESVIRFVETQRQCLDGLRFEHPGLKNVIPNPRRLEMLSDLARVLPPDLLVECAAGLMGPTYADAYAKVLAEEEAPLLAAEILTGYGKSRGRLQSWAAGNRMDLVNGTLDNVLHHLKRLDDAPGKRNLGNLCKFLTDLPPECLVKFLQSATEDAHKGGVGKAFAALRDDFPDFGTRVLAVMDKGVDLAVPVPA